MAASSSQIANNGPSIPTSAIVALSILGAATVTLIAFAIHKMVSKDSINPNPLDPGADRPVSQEERLREVRRIGRMYAAERAREARREIGQPLDDPHFVVNGSVYGIGSNQYNDTIAYPSRGQDYQRHSSYVQHRRNVNRFSNFDFGFNTPMAPPRSNTNTPQTHRHSITTLATASDAGPSSIHPTNRSQMPNHIQQVPSRTPSERSMTYTIPLPALRAPPNSPYTSSNQSSTARLTNGEADGIELAEMRRRE